MLSHLFVSNYALIDQLDIDFPEGFITITGETGAGKSILLGAIGLILGSRADISNLRNPAKKCIIEGHFNIEAYHLKKDFEELDIDYDHFTIIRREITPLGKSRAFINDSPINLKSLKIIGGKLMDIHSQFNALELSNNDFQLSLLDSYANTDVALAQYKKALAHQNVIAQELDDLKQSAMEARREEDYLNFSIEQLEKANIYKLDQLALENRKKILENSETIKSVLYKSSLDLFQADDNISARLATLIREIMSISNYNEQYQNLFNRLESIRIELDDLNGELDNLENGCIYDPKELLDITESLDNIYSLQLKFHVTSLDDLIALKEDMQRRLSTINSFDSNIKELEKKLEIAEIEVRNTGNLLSQKRGEACLPFSNHVSKFLEKVNLQNARFVINHSVGKKPQKNGFDQIYILFSANMGVEPGEISKVASGGELSRLMLAIKAVLANKKSLPTIIFDEIEAGVSGGVAGNVSNVLADMSKKMQVFAITHLPQIAGKSSTQYRVSKKLIDNVTISVMHKLSYQQRVEELALMLSNGKITDEARANAITMLSSNTNVPNAE